MLRAVVVFAAMVQASGLRGDGHREQNQVRKTSATQNPPAADMEKRAVVIINSTAALQPLLACAAELETVVMQSSLVLGRKAQNLAWLSRAAQRQRHRQPQIKLMLRAVVVFAAMVQASGLRGDGHREQNQVRKTSATQNPPAADMEKRAVVIINSTAALQPLLACAAELETVVMQSSLVLGRKAQNLAWLSSKRQDARSFRVPPNDQEKKLS